MSFLEFLVSYEYYDRFLANFDGKIEGTIAPKDKELKNIEREDFIDEGRLDSSLLSDASSDNS